jgi:hypothetical protein
MDAAKELFEKENCDYGRCRELLREIWGWTVIEDKHGLKTTSLHEAVSSGQYDFAHELIGEDGADLDVDPDGSGTVLWDLQYLYSETEEEQWAESEQKLRLIRALIRAGANPNPVGDSGEDFLHWIRFKVGEWEGTHPENYHLWQIEHIIEAHAYGETERFLQKLKEQAVSRVLPSDVGYWLMDDNLCDCDHAVLIFEDGERMMLSAYQVEDNEWDFYAVPLRDDLTFDVAQYHEIMPTYGSIRFRSLYSGDACPNLHYLDLSIDDAILRIHADEPNITVGIVARDDEDFEQLQRKTLF